MQRRVLKKSASPAGSQRLMSRSFFSLSSSLPRQILLICPGISHAGISRAEMAYNTCSKGGGSYMKTTSPCGGHLTYFRSAKPVWRFLLDYKKETQTRGLLPPSYCRARVLAESLNSSMSPCLLVSPSMGIFTLDLTKPTTTLDPNTF